MTNDSLTITTYAVEQPFCTSDHDSFRFIVTLQVRNSSYSNSQNCTAAPALFYWNKADWEALASCCSNIDWYRVLNVCNNANNCWATFTDILWAGIKCFVPRKRNNETSILRLPKKTHNRSVHRLGNLIRAQWRKNKKNLPELIE